MIISLCAFALSPAEAKRFRAPEIPSEPAMPLSAPLPPLPEKCAGAPTISGDALRFITLFGNIDWEGRATQVQMLEPSDECLKSAAVEAVRAWRFEPVDPETAEYWRLAFETTLIYPADGPPRFEMTPNDHVSRTPPLFPERCMNSARSVEMVAVLHDVTEEGETTNISSDFSTLECLTKSATRAVEDWEYQPRTVNGRTYPRQRVYTGMTFELSDRRSSDLRRAIYKSLLSLAQVLNRKLDARIALDQTALIEKRFGPELLDNERAALLRYKGLAKIELGQYEEALDDLRSALALEEDESTKIGLQFVIDELETALLRLSD